MISLKLGLLFEKGPSPRKKLTKDNKILFKLKIIKLSSSDSKSITHLNRQKVDLTKYIDEQSFTFDASFDENTHN